MNHSVTLSLDIPTLAAGLYMVATPIGNLKDISLRSLETLQAVDVILCEDTRVTQKLLKAYNIKASMKVYNDHSSEKDRANIAMHIEQGKAIALVSDAGTPLISDPGYKLVRQLSEQGIYITSLPGACALTTALTLSGIASDQFLFLGFLPPKQGMRENMLGQYKGLKTTLLSYERASRVEHVIESLKVVFGSGEVAICRELTKQYEEVIAGDVATLDVTRLEGLKGEVVIVFRAGENVEWDDAKLGDLLAELLEFHSVRDAVDIAMSETGKKKRELYSLALEIDGQKD